VRRPLLERAARVSVQLSRFRLSRSHDYAQIAHTKTVSKIGDTGETPYEFMLVAKKSLKRGAVAFRNTFCPDYDR
jgi:hypothetical protein